MGTFTQLNFGNPLLGAFGGQLYQVLHLFDDTAGNVVAGCWGQQIYSAAGEDVGYVLRYASSGQPPTLIAGGYDANGTAIAPTNVIANGVPGTSRINTLFTACLSYDKTHIWFVDWPSWNEWVLSFPYGGVYAPNAPTTRGFIRKLVYPNTVVTYGTDDFLPWSVFGVNGGDQPISVYCGNSFYLAADGNDVLYGSPGFTNGFYPGVGPAAMVGRFTPSGWTPLWTVPLGASPLGGPANIEQSIAWMQGVADGCVVCTWWYYGVPLQFMIQLWHLSANGTAELIVQYPIAGKAPDTVIPFGPNTSQQPILQGTAITPRGTIGTMGTFYPASNRVSFPDYPAADYYIGISTLVEVDPSTGAVTEISAEFRQVVEFNTNKWPESEFETYPYFAPIAFPSDGSVWLGGVLPSWQQEYGNIPGATPADQNWVIRWTPDHPIRQYPRNDQLAVGTPRQSTGRNQPSSTQSSARVGTRGTYT